MKRSVMYTALAAVLVASILIGCSDENSPSTPDEKEEGTITIDQFPDILGGAGWTLTGPENQSGSGDSTLTDMPVGEYTLTWDAVSGYVKPATSLMTLNVDATIAFYGTYVEEQEVGTVSIDQTPDILSGAGWTLTGPQNEIGSGDSTLADMPIGEYTLTWDVVGGFVTPTSSPQTLIADETITFTGTYIEESGPPEGYVPIPAGTFTMGSHESEVDRNSDETLHAVTLTTPFDMFSTEVTNKQYADMAQWARDNGHCTSTSTSLRDNLDGSTLELLDIDGLYCEISFDGSTFTVDSGKEHHPVWEVTWYGAVAYCDWLSLREGLPRAYDHSTWQCNGNAPYAAPGYRLPTEAEWEYACRAGTQTPFNTGSCLDAGTEANYNGYYSYTGCPTGPYVGCTVPVGSYPANTFDLYDMHGNLCEWCNDRYGAYSGDETDPVGASTGTDRVVRGGIWYAFTQDCRSARRYYFFPVYSFTAVGFRPVRSTF